MQTLLDYACSALMPGARCTLNERVDGSHFVIYSSMSRQRRAQRCGNTRVGPSAMLVLMLACTAFISTAEAAVLAVDLGSEFLKVSIVKPGRTPISIVLNEM